MRKVSGFGRIQHSSVAPGLSEAAYVATQHVAAPTPEWLVHASIGALHQKCIWKNILVKQEKGLENHGGEDQGRADMRYR